MEEPEAQVFLTLYNRPGPQAGTYQLDVSTSQSYRKLTLYLNLSPCNQFDAVTDAVHI